MEKLDYANALEAIAGIKMEAEANITSGDVSTNASARRLWLIADIMETFLTKVPVDVFNNPTFEGKA